jgi:hypothetical protein
LGPGHLAHHAILYNERDAQDIVHLSPGTGVTRVIGAVPNVQGTNGEGGLMGLEINPVTFSTDHWLYIMHTSNDNRIVRINTTKPLTAC